MVQIRNRKYFRWVLAALVVVVLGAALVLAWHKHTVRQAQKASGTIPTSKKAKAASGSSTKSQTTSTNQTNTSPSQNSTKLQGSAAGSAALETPFGSFVSNHMPGQSGSPTTEQSVCNTTPGATCDIQFTNGGVTKSLGAETADSNGSAYWSWDVKGANLAPGSWQITAVAKLNGQTKIGTDPTPLEVQ